MSMEMDKDEFTEIALEEWERVPTHFKNKVVNVALLIEDEPNVATLEEEELLEGSTLLGLYTGIPLTDRGEGYGLEATLPDTITLYRLPILDEALALEQSPSDAVRTVIRETIWHELGHYFGHDDLALEMREDEGSNQFL